MAFRHYKLTEELILLAAKTNANWLRDDSNTLFSMAANKFTNTWGFRRANNADLEHLISVLIEANLNVNAASNIDGHTPLFNMAAANHVGFCQKLIEKGANVNAACYTIDKAQSMFTPLHAAAELNALEACELLIKNGANIEQKDDNTKTPERVALERKCYTVVDLLKLEERKRKSKNENNCF